MNKIYFLLYSTFSILITFSNVFAQSPDWLWAKSAGGFNVDLINSVATDASGNVFVVGGFKSDTLVFGSTLLINSVVGAPYLDMFIVKYDNNGNALWAQSAGRWELDYAGAVTCDAAGNIYVAGAFGSNPITLGSYNLYNRGGLDVFIAKYNTNGTVIWAKALGGISDEHSSSICTDALGNIYVTGWFSSDKLFLESDTLINSTGNENIFILKYDSAGNALWAKSMGGNSFDRGNSISIDVSGNSYLTGAFYSDSVSFGSLVLTNSNPGHYAAYIVKFNSNGNELWAQTSSGNSDGAGGSSVATDARSNVYMTGDFSGPDIVFGSDTLTNDFFNTPTMFIVKFDSLGNELWAKCAVGSYSGGYSVATDMQGNTYVAGDFGDSIFFGGIKLLADDGDLFVVKYDGNGNAAWATKANGYGDESAVSIAVDPSGYVYVAGEFTGDTLAFSSSTLINKGGYCGWGKVCYDIFLAKLSSGPVGITPSANENSFIIYPNPLTSYSILQLNAQVKNAEVVIYDLLGKEIVRKPFAGNRMRIERGSLESGVYIVIVATNEKQYIQKIVVE